MAQAASNAGADASKRAGGNPRDADRLELTEMQKETVKVEAVSEHIFPIEMQSVGAIDFNGDMTVCPVSGSNHPLVYRCRWRCEEGPNAVHDRQPRLAASRIDRKRQPCLAS
jgi:hypothetical protein